MSQPIKKYTSLDEFKKEFLPVTGTRLPPTSNDPMVQGTFLAKQALAELTCTPTKPRA